jgi:hypothetical protein
MTEAGTALGLVLLSVAAFTDGAPGKLEIEVFHELLSLPAVHRTPGAPEDLEPLPREGPSSVIG